MSQDQKENSCSLKDKLKYIKELQVETSRVLVYAEKKIGNRVIELHQEAEAELEDVNIKRIKLIEESKRKEHCLLKEIQTLNEKEDLWIKERAMYEDNMQTI